MYFLGGMNTSHCRAVGHSDELQQIRWPKERFMGWIDIISISAWNYDETLSHSTDFAGDVPKITTVAESPNRRHSSHGRPPRHHHRIENAGVSLIFLTPTIRIELCWYNLTILTILNSYSLMNFTVIVCRLSWKYSPIPMFFVSLASFDQC